jgi:AbiV family abortive infection protein
MFELELDEAKEGFRKIIDNAEMLIKDTEILAGKDRYTSFPFGILSLEEIGKAILLAKTIQKSTQKVRIGKWWISHCKKLRSALTFNSGIPENLIDYIITTLEKARVEGLYVDWKDEMWIYPQHEGMAWLMRLRSPNDAEQIIGSAKNLLKEVKETYEDNL